MGGYDEHEGEGVCLLVLCAACVQYRRTLERDPVPIVSLTWVGIGGWGQGYALIGMLGCDLTYRFLLSQRQCKPQDAVQQYTPFT